MPRIDVPFVVENQQITQPTSEKLVSGGQNYFYATFEIKGVWEKISNIKAVFVRDAISKLVDLVETNKGYECQIPWEVMGYKGAFQVGVFGGDRMLTDYTYVIVKQGCVVEGEVPAPPSPDWFSEIEKYVAGLTDGASAYEIALENGFEGTEQEWLDSLHGYTPQKGTDYWTEEDKEEIKREVAPFIVGVTGSGYDGLSLDISFNSLRAAIADGVEVILKHIRNGITGYYYLTHRSNESMVFSSPYDDTIKNITVDFSVEDVRYSSYNLECQGNKTQDLAGCATSETLYPSAKAVVDYVDKYVNEAILGGAW